MRIAGRKIGWVGIVLLGVAAATGAGPSYLKLVRSAPLEGATVDFQAATRSYWQLTVSSPVGVDRPDLRLEITNHGSEPWLFSATGGGSLTLERVDGTPLKHWVRARGERRIEWMLVSPGESYTSLCQAEVKGLKDGTRELVYTSADGTQSGFAPLAAGKYKLQFHYQNAPAQSIDGRTTWTGNVETAPIEFEVGD